MTNDEGLKPEGAPERPPKAGAGAPSGVDADRPKRFSVQRKMAIVARLLRGEGAGSGVRETNVPTGKLPKWRERAREGAASALKQRERDERDDEIARLKSKVGEIPWTMSCSTRRSPPWRVNALWPAGGRDNEPDGVVARIQLCPGVWAGGG